MKENELRKHGKCSLCHKGIMHTGLPLFYRVKIERFGVDIQAAKRQDGLAAMLGSSVIANIMGPDNDLAKPVMDPVILTVCESCSVDKSLPVACLAELGLPENPPDPEETTAIEARTATNERTSDA